MDNVQFDVWSVLLSFGVFQGLFIVPAILRKRNQPSLFLAALVLIISLNVFNYLLLSSRLYQVLPHFLFVANPLLYWLGPFYFFYIRSLSEPGFQFKLRKEWLHFTPVLIGIAYHWQFIAASGPQKVSFLDNYFAQEELHANGIVIAYFSINIMQTLAYILVSRMKLRRAKASANGSKRGKYLTWLSRFSAVFAGYWLINFTGLLFLSISDGFFHEVDYIIMLTSAAVVNVLAFTALAKGNVFQDILLGGSRVSKDKSSMTSFEISQRLDSLKTVMEKEKPFLNAELKMNELAGMVGLTSNGLSELLNDQIGKSFYEFINDYRLKEAKEKLKNPEFSNYTILGIALESGFNNKNTFNRYFKKETGKTPSDFLKQLQK